jgi:hypothetical protein
MGVIAVEYEGQNDFRQSHRGQAHIEPALDPGETNGIFQLPL